MRKTDYALAGTRDRFMIHTDLVVTVGGLHHNAAVLYEDDIMEVFTADLNPMIFIQTVCAVRTVVQCDDCIAGRS